MTRTSPPIDVFVSYKREDRETAKALAEALALRGYSVWWDVDLLPGDRFADEIMAVIKRAKATIVLWSKASVASSFVRSEASVADGLERLIPARLDECELPLPFNILHTHDLTGWHPGADETLLAPLFDALEARTGKAPAAPEPPVASTANLHRQDQEAVLWRSISEQHEPSAEEYRFYLKTYPNGTFADLARLRLAKLKPGPLKWLNKKIIGLGAVAGAILAIIGLGTDLVSRLGFGVDESQPETAAETATPTQDVPPTTTDVETAGSPVTSDRDLQPGETFNDCNDEGWCPAMVVVPAGSFMMGSPAGEEGRRDNEGPQHRVTIGEPFALGVYEVTFDEWDACVADGGCNGYRPEDMGWGRGRRPVISVSWDDARAYVDWLSDRTGEAYRLPSEAEWEYAARAGTKTPFHFGSTISTDQANYDGDHAYGAGRQGIDRQQMMPVGSFPANAFGLHDVHGNVWEWVGDCWNQSYSRVGRPDDGTAWTSGDCGLRVLRGGSWSSVPRFLRSAGRVAFELGHRINYLGFRVAKTLR